MRQMLYGIGIVGLFIGCVACGGGSSKQASTQENLGDQAPLTRTQIEALNTEVRWVDTEYQFGEISANEVVQKRFEFINTGAYPLVILQVSASCGCVVTNWPREPIAVGDTSSLLVAFDSQGRTGVQHKKVYISANTTPNRHVLALQGSVLNK